MTKEEQNTEALKKARTFSDNKDKIDGFYNGYVQATIELQKQIQIDAEQVRALQKQNGELTDKVKELEAQIKKMQNCRNCKNEKIEGACGHFTQVGWCRDWELAD